MALKTLLQSCEHGTLQLPDFQRSWVWEEDRIKSLIASVSRGFPMGALMALDSRADGATVFARRPIEGAPTAAATVNPEQLLLDGQQRMTSLFQSCIRQRVVTTITAQKRKVERWFYIDIVKALAADSDREQAIFGVPEDRRLKANFDKDILLDLSSRELEFENLMYPLNRAFDFPEDWCKKEGISAKVYDTVVNKTPLGYRTNRIIGGVAPSKYLHKLQNGSAKAGGQAADPPIEQAILDGYLRSHCIPVDSIRADDFETFMTARQAALLTLISRATGHTLTIGVSTVEEGEELSGALAHDSGMYAETE